MALALALSRAQVGLDAPLVQVEVHLANGLPGLAIVGLPETAVKESRDRVRSAIVNAGFEFPNRRVTVNLAPADLPKEGGRYDLAIALGILAASGQVPAAALDGHEFAGELALSGALRPVPGLLAMALQTRAADRVLVAPEAGAAEAALVPGLTVRAAPSLLAVCAHLAGSQPLPLAPALSPPAANQALPDLAEVRGQHRARRALEIAAAGGHNLLLMGPPGTGKSLLAARLPGILPALDSDQALEVAALRSIAGLDPGLQDLGRRPFRQPHHTASAVALVGGGSNPRPGEISLAHHGLLFLDELPEFDRRVLEVLREPLESGEIHIARAARQVRFPARFQLVAAMNPCPCGYLGDPDGRCHCSPEAVRRYRARISGPLLDRIDLQVEVPRLPQDELMGPPGETSAAVAARVQAARQRQRERGSSNAQLSGPALDRHCALGPAERALLGRAIERLRLSARAYHRILRVARSIADLAGAAAIDSRHLGEAIQYRQLDRQG